MARKVTVPIDISSEQKVILGVISKRQLIYLIVGGLLIYLYAPKVYGLSNDPTIGVILALFSALPTAMLVILLGFMKHHKYSLNFDKYFLLKLGYKNQLGVWRKGQRVELLDNQKPSKEKGGA